MTFSSSILIPVYNQDPDILRACLRSALWQRGQEVQVVVVDDGSAAPFDALLVELEDEALGALDRHEIQTRGWVTYTRQANGGVAAALNAALSLATGTYIHWLSSDDLYHPDKVAKQVALMERNGASVSYCTYEDGVPHPQTCYPAVQYPTREKLFEDLRQQCFINACTVCWRADFLRKIGGFDPSFRHCQDYEVLLRSAQRENFAALNVPLVRRRVHAGQMLNVLRQKEEQEIKAQELARLNEMYGCTARLWVPK